MTSADLAADPRTRSTPFRVMLVEDDPAHALVLRRAFDALEVPVQLDHAEDGEEALERLAEAPAPPDLVLLDLKLTGLQGLDVLSRIKSTPSLITVPVVVLTTSSSTHDRAEACRRHANAYVQKPQRLEDFRSLVRTLVGFWGGFHLARRRDPGYGPN